MEPAPFPVDENRRLRCRLCFHAGNNSQLVEVFSKTHDQTKRVISALGVKINRSEKHARICVVCETLIDTIQSFQAVCKQTNQLHHERRDFLLYETFWSSREREAVKITEKMILNHRSEVDKTFSDVTMVSIPVKLEADRSSYASGMSEDPEQDLNSSTVHRQELEEKPMATTSDVPTTEMVLCEPEIKDEPPEDVDCLDQFQSELDQPVVSSAGEEDDDSDFRLAEVDSASSDSDLEKEESPRKDKPIKGRENRKRSAFIEDEEKEEEEEEMDTIQKPRRRGRKKKSDVIKEQSDDDREPRVKGKRGPRRKKIRKSDPSVCDICGKTVAYFVKESHRNQHLGVRPYKCDFDGCGRSYFSQNDLRTHSKRHQITYHVCEVCGRNIKGVEWFRRHVKTHTEGPQFTCEACGSKFRRKAQLQTHMVTHTGLTPHECEICGKRFALKYNLDAHVKRHQKKEEQEQEQEKAKDPKEYTEKRTWKYYVKTDTSDKKHHVTCETCGKSIHKREMEGHMNKHLERRPYSCDVPGCTLAFYGLRGIKEHKMVVHSDKVLRYDCSICNRSIKGAGTFKRHVMMHNSDMKVECKHCGKKFTSKSYLKAHEQKHSGERPFVCEICGRSFAMKACWKMHMKTVHKQDKREPTRVRKGGTAKAKQKEQIDVQLPANGELTSGEQTPSSAWTIDIQTSGEQSQYSQQLSLPQQPSQQHQHVVVQILAEIPHFPAAESVRADHSY